MNLRSAALWLGAFHLILGLAGFSAPFVVGGSPGLLNMDAGRLFAVLTTNWAHSGLHVGFGVYGFAVWRSQHGGATYFWSTAGVFGVLALLAILGHLGWLEVRGPQSELLVFELAVNRVGTALHLVLVALAGVALVLAGRAGEGPASRGMMTAPAILGMINAGVIAIILLLVLIQNTKVAPWADHGVEGRLHFQTKNVTRLGGDTAAVRQAVARALAFDEPAAAGGPAFGGDWRDRAIAAAGWSPSPRHMVALPGEGEDAALWALPGAYWAAFAGAPVVFVGRESPGADAEAVAGRLGLPIYLLAPRSMVSDEVEDRLSELAPTRRVSAEDLAGHAVAIARHRDHGTGFGWGRDQEDHATWFHFVMAAPQDADAAYLSLPLGRTVAAPFLFSDSAGGIPGATDVYWWSLRADWAATPSETSFRHLWIIGDRVSYAAQSRMDLAVEKAPYISKGSVGLSGLEGVGIVLIALGIAGFAFVLLHGTRLLPDVMPAMRIAWAFTALLLPVAGVILYVGAYRRPRTNAGEDMAKWIRPPAIQAAAATAMGFGYGAPLMIVVGWAFAFYGFPLFFGQWASGWPFVLGAGMPLMMIGMYVGAVLLAWPFVQAGMQAMMNQASRRAVMWRALGVTALSMAAVSLGMMAMSWFMMMERDPMMMPHEDEIMWIISLWLASMIGFLVAWPLNWPMVRTQLKSGTM